MAVVALTYVIFQPLTSQLVALRKVELSPWENVRHFSWWLFSSTVWTVQNQLTTSQAEPH